MQPGPRPVAVPSIKWKFRKSVLFDQVLNTPAWQQGAASFFSSRLGPDQLADVLLAVRNMSRHVNPRKISAEKHKLTCTLKYAVGHDTVDPLIS